MVIQNIKKLPYPGFRNIKTGIAILICLIIYDYIGREGAPFAVIAILVCMQDSVEKSIREGFNRVIGTVMGASFGIIFIYLDIARFPSYIYLTLCALGIVLYIYVCNLIKIKNSIIIGCVVYIMIIVGPNEYSPILYSINRTIDTILGIIIAVVINRLLFKPKPERFKGKVIGVRYLIFDIKKTYQCNNSIWRGGTSTELYIYPKNSLVSERDFDFRISTTNNILEHSILGKFKGYMRHIMLLEGEMRLDHKEYHTVKLEKFSQDFFKGDWNTEAYGKSLDLSLTYKYGYEGSLEPLSLSDKKTFNIKKVTGFYCIEDNIKIKITKNGEEVCDQQLEPKDFIFFRDDKNDGKEVYVIELESLGENKIPDDKVVVIMTEVWVKNNYK